MTNEETKPKRQAKDNPWYRLATLHGQPEKHGDGGITNSSPVGHENRIVWNRWMAPEIPDDLKSTLLQNGWTTEELSPLSEEERCAIAARTSLSFDDWAVDFSNTEFEDDATFWVAGFVFPHNTFRYAFFRGGADFRNTAFRSFAEFGDTTFSGRAYFQNAVFSASSSFTRTVFSANADFSKATFEGGVAFDEATFSDRAAFDGAALRNHNSFRGVTFSRGVGFRSATLSRASFECATFSGFGAIFQDATFSGSAEFQDATFGGEADFVNAEMKGLTRFDRVKFSRPPMCFNAKLHEGTTWHGVDWPKTPSDPTNAQEFADAYERIKLEMDKLKKHGDELDFFARELRCRRVIQGFWKGLPIALYGFLSNYGRSYVHPLSLLVAIILLGAVPFAVYRSGGICGLSTGCHAREALGISFANTVSLLGKPLMKSDIVVADFPEWLKAIATFQTILGIVLLFLFGLGVRNRFRMK